MIGFSTFGTAALIVFTGVWTLPVLRRLPEDVHVLRGSEPREEKLAVAAIWGLTALLLTWSLRVVLGLVAGVLGAFS